MTQLFAEHLFSGAEVFLLVFMAYDLYLAICKPLHYLTIMNHRVCVLMLLLAWVGGFLHALLHIIFFYNFPFCGPNVIDHFGCDTYPLLKLACTDTHITDLTGVANDGAICVTIFTLILISCGVILCSLKNLRKGSVKPCPPVAPTLQWWSSYSCPVFLHIWDLLLPYPLINTSLCFTPLSPLCWNL